MALDMKPAAEHPQSPGHAASAAIHELDRQRLRILRCTAHAMASSPGGLRFKPGTRPWLEGLSASAGRHGQCVDVKTRPAAS
ncbi:MAG: hypothetical protein I8H91_01470 [Burkholderiales bacterium]|nr:hypothetical protein [Burkholderiales bacterium]